MSGPGVKAGQVKRRLIWGAIVIGLLVAVDLAAFGFVRNLPAWQRGFDQADLAAYFLAAEVLNRGGSPYDAAALDQAAGDRGVAIHTPYIYPPFLAAVLRPIAPLPFPIARLLWLGINLAALAAGAIALARWYPRHRGRAAFAIFVAGLLLPATFNTLSFGQVNLVLLALLAVAIVAVRARPADRRIEVLAGIAIGLAAAIKVFPALLAIGWIARRKWNGLAGTAGAFAAAGLIGLVFGGGWDATRHFYLNVASGIGSGIWYPTNQSIAAGVDRLLTGHPVEFSVVAEEYQVATVLRPLIDAPAAAAIAGPALSGLVLLATLVELGRRVRRGKGEVAADFILLLLTSLLVSPLVWDHYHVLLLIPLAGLGARVVRARDSVAGGALAAASLALAAHRYWRLLVAFAPSALPTSFALIGTLICWLAYLWSGPFQSQDE